MDTHTYTHPSTPTQPLESLVGTAGHTARGGGGGVCVGGEEGWLCQSGLAARALSQHPGLDHLYLHSWVAGEGKGLPGPCILALHLFRFPTLLLGQVWRPTGKAGATPPPEQTSEERVGWGWCGSTGDTTHPITVAQARRGTAGAEAGGRPLWTGKSHRQGGRRGREAGRLGGWGAGGGAWAQAAMPEAPCLEPGPGPSTALPGGSIRRRIRPYLAGEHQPGHLPPSRSNAVGTKGTAWLRPELTGASPGQGTMGLRYPAPLPREQAQAYVTRASPGRQEAQVLGTWAGGVHVQPLLSTLKTGLLAPCLPFPARQLPSSGGLRPLNATLPPSSSHPLWLLYPTLPLKSLPTGEAAMS